jgi:hypothetical protein
LIFENLYIFVAYKTQAMKNLHSESLKDLFLTALMMAAFAFLLNVVPAHAQMTVLNNTKVVVSTGSSLNSTQNVVLNAGGNLDVQGTLILKKDLVNQNASANSLGTGTVEFSGTIPQSMTGQNVIQNLNVNNATGLTVGGETRVNGTMTLTSGLVTLGSNNMLLGPMAIVAPAPAPSASNMVVATGSGELRKEFPPEGGNFTFPVGDADGTAEYSPVTLAFNSGTFGTNNYAGVSLVNAQYSGTGTSYLTRYWTVTQSGITGFSCNTTFQYVEADIQGTEADIYSTRVVPTPFTAFNPANTSTNELTAHGIGSFSTFTGNLGNGTTPPDVRSLQDKTVSTTGNCADAQQTLLIAGNGTYYNVTSTGSVEHIAGTNIIYYPGTDVDLGGYLRGHIATTFCNPYIHPAQAITGIEAPANINTGNNLFKIYPNPTPGRFTLELNGNVTEAQVHVEIFGLLGERILSRNMPITHKQEFSLADKPTGVYVVHVSSGTTTETEKIIKR